MAPVFPQSFGPFKGCRFTPDPGRRDPNFAYYAKNMFPNDPVNGGPYVRRVAEQSFTINASGTLCQWIGVFRKRSGFVTVSVQDGEIYTWASGTWTRRVTTANLTSGSVTLSASARVFAVTYNNTLVFNDGVNRPFTWDGTAGASGLVSLTSAPSKCYGKPFVHYAKLGFIKDVAAAGADRSTFVWSEENAANTGYENGYSNVWTLNQNGQGALYAMVGTNSGLYYFRAESIGVIRGAITPQFTTDGVHDGVSGTVGTTCPDVLWYDRWLYFFDLQGKPFRFPEGGIVDPLWREMADVFTGPDVVGGTYNPAFWTAGSAHIAALPWYKGVVFGFYSLAATKLIMWAFDHETGNLQCELDFNISGVSLTIALLGEMYDETNFRTVLAAGTSKASVILPLQDTSAGTGYFPESDSVERRLTVGPFGSGDEAVWDFTRLSTQLVVGRGGFANPGQIAVSVTTSETPSGSLTAQADMKTFTHNVSYQYTKRLAWDVQQHLRWAMASIYDGSGVTTTQEGWGVYSVTMMAVPSQIEADKT